jgi:pimeloyl-ACP methyl ester carboxylesterase
MSEAIEIQIHGQESSPNLVYLPGLHGDWTLIGSFRKALGGQARLIEITYPRTLNWSLEDYAIEVEKALEGRGITRGWLLGESFGSQVVWPLVSRNHFRTQGIIFAGGFARHPFRWAVRLAEQASGRIPLALLVRVMFGYARLARFRFRRAPETLADIGSFIARRTELDRRAATHRLHLVAQSDPNPLARQIQVPVYALSGWLDPIVPWPLARSGLRRHCPALREYRIIGRADHNVLSTAPKAAAQQVLRWMMKG